MFNMLPQLSDITAFLITGLGTMVFKLIEKKYDHHKNSMGEDLRKELQKENKRLQHENKRIQKESDAWKEKFLSAYDEESTMHAKIERLEGEIKRLRCDKSEDE